MWEMLDKTLVVLPEFKESLDEDLLFELEVLEMLFF
jgi:hypothetical protein